MWKLQLYAVLILLLFISNTSFAKQEKQLGLEGDVTVGMMFINSANNLNPNSSSRYLDNLSSSPEKEFTAIPLIMPELKYVFNSPAELTWYLTSNPPIDEAGTFGIISGLGYPVKGFAYIDGGFFYMPFGEAWKNPYVVGGAREETDQLIWGAQLAANKILGSNFRTKFVYVNDSVEDDEIGQIFPQMLRDGEVYSIAASYDFLEPGPYSLRPRISFRKGKYDGESNSFSKFKADIKGRYIAGKLFLMPQIFYSYKENDEVDPIFNRTRKEHGIGISVVVNYANLFGYDHLALRGMAGYSKGEANEDFYDTESLYGGLGIVWVFK